VRRNADERVLSPLAGQIASDGIKNRRWCPKFEQNLALWLHNGRLFTWRNNSKVIVSINIPDCYFCFDATCLPKGVTLRYSTFELSSPTFSDEASYHENGEFGAGE
jgi:hypothetical protein